MNRLSTQNTTVAADQMLSFSNHFAVGKRTETEELCVHHWFEDQVKLTPNAIALRFGEASLSYDELNDRANRLANYLRGTGVAADTLVGVALDRSFELVISVLGILKAGGAYVPLDPAYPAERIRTMVDAARLDHLITNEAGEHGLGDVRQMNVVLVDKHRDAIDRCNTGNPEPCAAGNRRVYVIFTSGSTGAPKAAAVYHRGFTNLVQWFVNEFVIGRNDNALLLTSFSFDLTQKNLFATLIRGGTLHLSPTGPYDLSALSRTIHEHHITLINCTPSGFYPLIEPLDAERAALISSLRLVVLGGEPISVARVRPWLTHATNHAEVANTYGPTECTDICGFYRLNRDNLDQYDFVPLGRPIQNTQMVILDPEGRLCPVGVTGELCVGGAGVGAGYLNDLAKTREKFVDHDLSFVSSGLLYRTGDQAHWHPDGVIEFQGRLDHQVKIRGFRIELPEIERVTQTHPQVTEAVVVVSRNSQTEEAHLVCCVTSDRGQDFVVSEIRNHLSERLLAHMIPGSFEKFERFPLSPNGKIDRNSLTELVYQRHHQTERSPQVPTDSTEELVRSSWLEVLNRGSVDLDVNFFDLGGDSLSLGRLHQLLERKLDRTIAVTDLFAHTTIRTMARHLSSDSDSLNPQQRIRQRAIQQRQARAARQRKRS